jgi:hypothetical protein
MSSHSVQDGQKVTVVLPRTLLARLDTYVPARKRSHFIAEAIEDRLALAEQAAAIEESAGAWSDENHPDLRTGDDVAHWLAALRGSWELRLDDEHA